MTVILRVLISAAVVFVLLKTSMCGWRCSGKSDSPQNKVDLQLAAVLKSHVHKLAQEIGERSVFKYEKLTEAASYIEEQLFSFGYQVEFQDYHVYDKTVKNIIATKAGVEKPEEIIIVGAHYDSCFNPGADDNASAVSGLLELARFMAAKETKRTVKFIAFVNEEPPFFMTKNMGSRVYTRAAKARQEDIKAVVILEMIGYYSEEPRSQRYPPILGLFYPNKGNFIAVVGNFRSRWLVKKVVASFRKETKFPIESLVAGGFIPGVDFSDHWSFWKEGYPAVMITDTAFYRNPHYHSSTDTYEKLDYESMAAVVEGLRGVVIKLAE